MAGGKKTSTFPAALGIGLLIAPTGELSVLENIGLLSTSVGAIKAALHRGRAKLTKPDPDVMRTPAPEATRSAPRSTRATSNS